MTSLGSWSPVSAHASDGLEGIRREADLVSYRFKRWEIERHPLRVLSEGLDGEQGYHSHLGVRAQIQDGAGLAASRSRPISTWLFTHCCLSSRWIVSMMCPSVLISISLGCGSAQYPSISR